MTPLASTTEPEGRGWGGLSAFALGSPGARRPQTGRQPPEAGFGEVLGGRSVTSRRVWRKNPSRPGGLPGPRPTRGGGRAGTRRVGPELASGKAPPLRRTAPPLRGTTQGRPGGRPPRPNQGVTPGRPQAPASGRALRPRDRAAGQPAPRPASRPLRPRLRPRFPRPGLPARSRGRRRALPGLERRKDLARQGVAARRAGSAAGESRW